MSAWLFFIFVTIYISLLNHTRPMQNYYLSKTKNLFVYFRCYHLLFLLSTSFTINLYAIFYQEWQWNRNIYRKYWLNATFHVSIDGYIFEVSALLKHSKNHHNNHFFLSFSAVKLLWSQKQQNINDKQTSEVKIILIHTLCWLYVYIYMGDSQEMGSYYNTHAYWWFSSCFRRHLWPSSIYAVISYYHILCTLCSMFIVFHTNRRTHPHKRKSNWFFVHIKNKSLQMISIKSKLHKYG